jgi:hypothetical protein
MYKQHTRTHTQALGCLVHPEDRYRDHLKRALALVAAGRSDDASAEIHALTEDCLTLDRARLGTKV